MNETAQILRGMEFSPVFESFGQFEKEQIARAANVRSYKAREFIFTIQNKEKFFFLVYSGELSLRLKTRKIKKYKKGDIFGEVSIFANEYRSGNIRALADSILIAFDIRKVFDAAFVETEIQLKLLRKLTEIIISRF